MVDAVYLKDNGGKKTKMSRASVREMLVNLPEITGYPEEAPVLESLENQILRHCEDVSSGTITKSDLTDAILKA